MASEQLKVVVDMLRANPPVAGDDIAAMRAGMEAATREMPVPEDVRFEPTELASVACEWTIAPGAAEDRVLVYFHGGGYVMGSIATHRGLVAGLSRAAGARVLSVDYRLAPEHPAPAAVEDATAVYRELLKGDLQASEIGLGGDSAGGGLTAAALVALREAGDEMPGAGVLISPWLDLTQSGESIRTRAEEDPMMDASGLQMMADAYTAGADPKSATISPLFADLSDLPPLLIHVGTAEVLLDDSLRFAERAEEADVEVELEVWDDMIHVWHAFSAVLPEAQTAINTVGAFLKREI